MKRIQKFGSSRCRSGSGALLGGEIERIKGFLLFRSLLLAECFDSHIVISHPSVAKDVIWPLTNNGFQPIILGASLHGLRQVTDLSVGETRILEGLAPGPIILIRNNSELSMMPAVAIPDSLDLRDIGHAYGGAVLAFLWIGECGCKQLEEIIYTLSGEGCSPMQLGVLEPSWSSETEYSGATAVHVTGSGNVECIAEGAVAMDRVRAVFAHMSQWEIEDWT